MIYYITKRRTSENHAGKKAPADIDLLCKKLGWTDLPYPDTRNWQHPSLAKLKRAISILHFWLVVLRKLQTGDAVFYQHPIGYGTKIAAPFLRKLQKKGVKFIVLIHDLESIRYHNIPGSAEAKKHYEDDCFLKLFDALICHNAAMRCYLADQGIESSKIVCLNLFDYLLSSPVSPSTTPEHCLIVAGNLEPEKCGYVYKLADLKCSYSINLYGVHYDAGKNPTNALKYCGNYDPDKLPYVMAGKYGLIWDGNSIDTCSGITGNYLRYNNPHKLSLFIASGIPVITWREAAIADFVLKNGIGVVVESLHELPKLLECISDNTYQKMMENIIKIQPLVINGSFFQKAIDSALRIVFCCDPS